MTRPAHDKRVRSHCPCHLVPLGQSPDNIRRVTLTSVRLVSLGPRRTLVTDGVICDFVNVISIRDQQLLTNHIADISLVDTKTKCDRRAYAAAALQRVKGAKLENLLDFPLPPVDVDSLFLMLIDSRMIHPSLHIGQPKEAKCDLQRTLMSPTDQTVRASATLSAS